MRLSLLILIILLTSCSKKKIIRQVDYNNSIISNEVGTNVLIRNGKLSIWGGFKKYGADSSNIQSWLDSKNIKRVISSNRAFVAISMDNEVNAWGKGSDGGKLKKPLKNIKTIIKNKSNNAFAAIDINGNIFSWGKSSMGGNLISMNNVPDNVNKLYSSNKAFLAISKNKNSFIWSEPIELYNNFNKKLSNKEIKNVYSSQHGFLLETNSNIIHINTKRHIWNEYPLKSSIKKVVANEFNFLVLYNTGSLFLINDVLPIKEPLFSTNIHASANNFIVETPVSFTVFNKDSYKKIYSISSVKTIKENPTASYILLNNGSVIRFNERAGLNFYYYTKKELNNIKEIYNNEFVFLFRTYDDKIISTGFDFAGGLLEDKLQNIKIKKIYPSRSSFALLDYDFKIHLDGDPDNGGTFDVYIFNKDRVVLYNIKDKIKNKKIIDIYPGQNVFFAKDENNNFYSWGAKFMGANFFKENN